MTLELYPGERLDDLQRNGYQIIQNPKKFCFGIDAVLLSGFAKARAGEEVLDIGTGTGVIPILMAARTKGRHFTGLEIQHESADMAMRSVAYNGLQERIAVIEGDMRQAGEWFSPASFDVITSNPPYLADSHGRLNQDPALAAARHEICGTLEDLVSQAEWLLKARGRLYLVHRPGRLPEIFAVLMRHGLEPKRMRLVYPFVDREPNLVLIEARKGGKPGLIGEPPLIVYREKGVYTPEIYEIYGEDAGGDADGRREEGNAVSVCDADRQSGGHHGAGSAHSG